jgi:hypothetical protein
LRRRRSERQAQARGGRRSAKLFVRARFHTRLLIVVDQPRMCVSVPGLVFGIAASTAGISGRSTAISLLGA